MRNCVLLLCAVLIAGCSDADPVSISFATSYGDTELICESGPNGLRLTDMRLYIHDVALQSADGEWHPLELDTDTPWQNESVALLDLESGGGACRGGTDLMHGTVTGRAAGAPHKGLRFTIGVPFELNHRDPVRAASPLNQAVMHWHWQGGYKFMRVGLRDGEAHAWFHLGSTQCQGVIGDISGCNHPNRITVTLADFDPAADRVTFDLAALFQGLPLTAPRPQACMSDADSAVCAPLLRNLGLTALPADATSFRTDFVRAARD